MIDNVVKELGDFTNDESFNNYTKLQVPPGIRYISQWRDFKLPSFPHIMDKEIPGCGFTEWCLSNSQDLVLCSPRRVLLQNKSGQHPEVFLVKTILDNDKEIDKDLVTKKKQSHRVSVITSINDEEEKENSFLKALDKKSSEYKTTHEKVSRELKDYIDSRKSQSQPVKILVTYDSFGIVKEVLRYFGILDNFQIVIDEFQSIFTDSRFKSDTELTLLEQLKDLQKVCYLSATPMMRNYLKMMKEFKDLPYYELDWNSLDPGRVIRPILKVRTIKNVSSKIKEIIGTYLSGKYKKVYLSDGSVKESREAVFFVNSINNICNTIKSLKLTPEQCCIICSDTPNNEKRIEKSLGGKFKIEKVPLMGEPRKMFTFCTRTVYLGADFYSDNARTFILSDANVETLAVDISLDLPQIMGRQRLEENPWRNEAEFYYKPLGIGEINMITKEKVFGKLMNDKISATNKLLKAYKEVQSLDAKLELAKRYKKVSKMLNYEEDYVAVNRNKSGNLDPVFNRLVLLAELRAFEIQKIDYSDRFFVFQSINNAINPANDIKEIDKEVKKFYKRYDEVKDNIKETLKLYCESGLSDEAKVRIYNSLPANIKSYLSLGEDKIKAVEYYPEIMNKLLGNTEINIDNKIYDIYKVGDRLVKSELKKQLQKLYDDSGIYKKAKATDIEKWFETKRVLVKNPDTNKKIDGIELIKKLL